VNDTSSVLYCYATSFSEDVTNSRGICDKDELQQNLRADGKSFMFASLASQADAGTENEKLIRRATDVQLLTQMITLSEEITR